MNLKTLFLLLFTLALLFLAGCIESTIEPTADEYKTLSKTLKAENIDLVAAVKNGQEKVAVCHNTDSETNPLVLINVAVSALDAHLTHGDGLPYSPVEGYPDLYYNENCEPVPDTTAPICTYEISNDNSLLTYTAVDDLSGIISGGTFCSNCSSLSLNIDGGLTATAIITKGDPNLDTDAGADFSDRAGNSVICEPVTF